MYVDKIMEEVLTLLFTKKKELKKLQKDYRCELSLCVVSKMNQSRVNPCISPSKKVIKFLGDINANIDYDVYC